MPENSTGKSKKSRVAPPETKKVSVKEDVTGASFGTAGVHHRGDQEVGSGRLGKGSAPSNVIGQSGGGAQGKREVEAVY